MWPRTFQNTTCTRQHGHLDYLFSHDRETYVRTPALIEPIDQNKTILVDVRGIMMIMGTMSNVSDIGSVFVRSHEGKSKASPKYFPIQSVCCMRVSGFLISLEYCILFQHDYHLSEVLYAINL